MSTLTPAPGPMVPETLACLKCQYSLRGLAPTAACPECATPIERTLLGDLLVYSGPVYIQKLRAGSTLIMAALVVALLGAVIPVMAAIVLSGSVSMVAITVVGGAFFVVSAILFLLGWWNVASPDPSQLGEDRGERVRLFVRWGGVLTVVIQVAQIVLNFGTFPSWFTEAFDMFGSAVVSAALLAGLWYVKWLARRVPSARVVKRGRTLIVLCSILLAYSVLTTVARLAGVGIGVGGVGPTTGLFGVMRLVMGILYLVTFVMYYNLFSWLKADLEKALAAARG